MGKSRTFIFLKCAQLKREFVLYNVKFRNLPISCHIQYQHRLSRSLKLVLTSADEHAVDECSLFPQFFVVSKIWVIFAQQLLQSHACFAPCGSSKTHKCIQRGLKQINEHDSAQHNRKVSTSSTQNSNSVDAIYLLGNF